MKDRNNTIAGWVLGAGIVALGAGIVSSEYFRAERPEKMGYPIEGVVEAGAGGAAAEVPIATRLATADPAHGATVFQKCAACHTATKGGPNGVGPNLYGVVGEPIGQGVGGFAFSDALKSKGGNWDFESLDKWLTSPRKFADGTKMTFAGLSNGKDRADVIAYLNQNSDSPKPLPKAEAAPADVPGPAGKSADTGAGPDKVAPGAPSVDPHATEQAAKKGNMPAVPKK
ncbi:putative cytochrome c [Sphingomonas changbaiensis NBRC 104936]|uniref:Putative cytochrome c n=1 Tax=Sphingomonas changbaiensis NBRC 104936 TaxID=1219043 RepID=A0A0E9MRZ3_9SPHN|nr:cytochrome c family protein [Sphingomonas changbaiensis]GAO39885.1 putative cytochrome c [Sphingomonas changbaiensis NBRC 104936]